MGSGGKDRNKRATVDATVIRRPNRGPKPAKPYPEFPLYAHAGGTWAKRIRGREYYFGPWSDPDGALKRYLRDRDYLHAGQPPPAAGDAVTLDELVNRFLAAQRLRQQLGEISHWHYSDQMRDGRQLLDALGRTRPVRMLSPADFARLRQAVSVNRNATTIASVIIRIRSMFAWAVDDRLIDALPEYGRQFSAPSARHRRQALAAAGPRDLSAVELRAVLAAADMPTRLNLRLAVLLGINCGMGNTDCSELRREHLALTTTPPMLVYPRPKTGMARRAVLWPETTAAIAAVIEQLARRQKRDVGPADRVLLTRNGRHYVHVSPKGTLVNNLTREFAKLAVEAGLPRHKHGFYCLRRTFQTIADGAGDGPAVALVMGHVPAPGDMAARYRQRIDDSRLLAIASHVRAWLWPMT